MADETASASWRFLSLVSWLNELALRGLGKVQDPVSGEVMRNLDLARATIDWLDVIETKTTGNLSDEESRFLRQVLTTLRLNYVDEVESEKKAPEAKGESETEPE